jgi:Protein of unknown function (DUF3551)
MRLFLFILGILVGLIGIENRAEAQNYPWCAMLNMGDQAINCGFVSHAQCMATVSGIGGLCTPNNTFQPPPGPRPLTRVYRRYPY